MEEGAPSSIWAQTIKSINSNNKKYKRILGEKNTHTVIRFVKNCHDVCQTQVGHQHFVPSFYNLFQEQSHIEHVAVINPRYNYLLQLLMVNI